MMREKGTDEFLGRIWRDAGLVGDITVPLSLLVLVLSMVLLLAFH